MDDFNIGSTMPFGDYNWRTHLNWEFGKLSISKADLGSYVNSLSYIEDWKQKVDLISKIIVYFKDYIDTNDLLPVTRNRLVYC